MDEFEIIAKIFAPLATAPGAFGLKDDAAVIAPQPGHDLVVTTDQIAEGIDFFADDPPATIAQKALRVNLSDLAAKGAGPAYYLLSLSLPPTTTMEWLQAFAGGLHEDQKEFHISLLGGDTSRSEGPLTIAITAFGYVPEGTMITRSGARPGDAVYVTRQLGASAAGLAILKGKEHHFSDLERDQLIGSYRVPDPRVDIGIRLTGMASAAIDVSDGLVADLGHIASASGVRIVVDGESIPIHPDLKKWWGADAIPYFATAGDDYEIAFTGPSDKEDYFLRACGFTRKIGTVMEGEGVELRLNGQPVSLPKTGYRHF